MNDSNRKLLSEVVNKRLNEALLKGVNSDEGKLAFDEAMKAVDREIELKKLDEAKEVELKKLEEAKKEKLDNDKFKADEAKKDRIVRFIEIGALMIAVPIVDTICKKAYAKVICNFEKDYTFTTTPGRQLSGLFRFKK